MLGKSAVVLLFLTTQLFVAGCATQPTGSAAHLHEVRRDLVAELAVAKKKPPRDLDGILSELRFVPKGSRTTNIEAVDNVTSFISLKLGSQTEIMKRHQEILEDFRDVASFLSVNFAKTPEEFRSAVASFDSAHPNKPISNRLERFAAAHKTIFEENARIEAALSKTLTKSVDPTGWVMAGANAAAIGASELLSLPSLAMATLFCPSGSTCKPIKQGTIKLCTKKRGQAETCVTRRVEEHKRLVEAAISNAQAQVQAIANASAYIDVIQRKTLLLGSLGRVVLLPRGALGNVEELSKREEHRHYFAARSASFPVPHDVLWDGIKSALVSYGHEFEILDEQNYWLVTDYARRGFLSKFFNAGRYYTKYYVAISGNGETGNRRDSTMSFKQFLYKPKLKDQLTPITATFQLVPNQDREAQKEKEDGFVSDVASEVE